MNYLGISFRILAPVILSFTLITCGGGGGDSTGTPDPEVPTGTPSVPDSSNITTATFNKARSFNDNVTAVVAADDSSGDVYVAGEFTTYNSSVANHLIRLNSNGSIDTSFIVGSGFNGVVNSLALAKDSSGDIYVGGDFNTYNGDAVSGVVRLNSDGSLDTGFATKSGDSYTANMLLIAPDGSGDIYFGGNVLANNPFAQHRLLRLNSDGSVDTAFNTGNSGLNGAVHSMVPVGGLSTGIYVGGILIDYNGISTDNLIRLNADGSRDTGFNTSNVFNDAVNTIAVALDESGDIYVGGLFTTSFNSGANKLLRLNANGSIDTAFNTTDNFYNNDKVNSIVVLADGSGDIYVGGKFSAYKPDFVANALGLVRIHNDGSMDTAFDMSTGFNGTVNNIAPLPGNSGEIYIGGEFNNFKSTPINHLARISNTGNLLTDASVTGTGFSGQLIGVKVIINAGDSSGDIYVGGDFSHYNGILVNRLIRLNSDGSIDTGFNTGSGFNNTVSALAVATDGSGDLYAVGSFTSYKGISNPHIIRLNVDGSVDTNFAIGSGFNTSSINSIAIARDASNAVYVGGNFTTYKGVATGNSIIRLNADGSKDADFNMGTGFLQTSNQTAGQVDSIVPLNDLSGDLYVGGRFNEYDSTIVNHLVRLNSDGSIDTQLDTGTGFNSGVNNIVLTTDTSGDLYVSGLSITDYNSNTGIKRIVRLNADGSMDTGFVAPGLTNYQVNDIMLAPDNSGDLYVAGLFGGMGPAFTKNILRLNSDGSIDTGFTNNTGTNAKIYALAVADDGSNDVFAGGLFTSYSTTTVDRIARIQPDGVLD